MKEPSPIGKKFPLRKKNILVIVPIVLDVILNEKRDGEIMTSLSLQYLFNIDDDD